MPVRVLGRAKRYRLREPACARQQCLFARASSHQANAQASSEKAIGSERVGTSKVAAYASATRIATVPRYWSSGTGKNEEIPSLRLSTSFKAQIEPKGLFRQQQTKLRAPERRPLLPRIAYGCGHERRPSRSNSAYRRSSRRLVHRNSERNPPIWGVARH